MDASSGILVFGDAFFGFLSIFCRFGMDFGKIWGWHFDDFSHFRQKSRFGKNRCFSYGKTIFKDSMELAKINQKSIKNPCKFPKGKSDQKNAQEMDFGRSWAPFGGGLGRSGASFGRSWALLGHFGNVQNRAFVKH